MRKLSDSSMLSHAATRHALLFREFTSIVHRHPVRSVNFRRKSLAANTFSLQDADSVCGWPAQAVMTYVRGNPSWGPRLLANLKTLLYAETTYGEFRRRWIRIIPCLISTWAENGHGMGRRKWYLKALFIFKLSSAVTGRGFRVAKVMRLAVPPAARDAQSTLFTIHPRYAKWMDKPPHREREAK